MIEEEILNRELLEYLQEACEQMTQSYKEQTGRKVRFEVLQFSNIAKCEYGRDIIREVAQIYDEYTGKDAYIHTPDVGQMSYNFMHYPIIGTINEETGEIEGVATIKHNRNTEEDIDPYYPKKGVSYYSITGIIVRQREGIGNKGLGTNMYEAATLGLQRYAKDHQEEKFEVVIVIDCTNVKSLYANANANANIDAKGLVGDNQGLLTTLDGIYIVTDRTGRLIEAPTFVIKEDIYPKDNESIDLEDEERTVFSYQIDANTKNANEAYEQMLKQILERIRPNQGKIQMTTMYDEDAGYVTYIPNQGKRIQLENIVIKTNGAEEYGENRVPRNDVHKYQGPMPNIYINRKEGNQYDGDER